MAVVACGTDGESAAPTVHIRSVLPPQGPRDGGTALQIVGEGFVAEGLRVRVGGVSALVEPVVYDDGSLILAASPRGIPGWAEVEVECAAGRSSLLQGYEYRDAEPHVAGLYPECGGPAGGTDVAIWGEGLAKEGERPSVYFGVRSATRVEVMGPSRLQVAAPPGRGRAEVRVINNHGELAAGTFDYSEACEGPVPTPTSTPEPTPTPNPSPCRHGTSICGTATIFVVEHGQTTCADTTEGVNATHLGEACSAGNPSLGSLSKDQVWGYKAPASGVVTVEVEPLGAWDVQVSVRSSCLRSDCAAGVDAGGPGDPESLTFNAVAGKVYAIVVDGAEDGTVDGGAKEGPYLLSVY